MGAGHCSGHRLLEELWIRPIIYLAALSGVNVNLYESAAMDGANRLKQICT